MIKNSTLLISGSRQLVPILFPLLLLYDYLEMLLPFFLGLRCSNRLSVTITRRRPLGSPIVPVKRNKSEHNPIQQVRCRNTFEQQTQQRKQRLQSDKAVNRHEFSRLLLLLSFFFQEKFSATRNSYGGARQVTRGITLTYLVAVDIAEEFPL